MLLETPVARRTTPGEAAQLVRELYGLNASAQLLPGEYDENFQLAAVDGSQFVLKLMHPARDSSFVDLQCQALQHLSAKSPQLGFPRVVPSRNGELFTQATLPDGARRLVWLLTFIPGTPLAKARPHSTNLLADLGKFLGALDMALLDFAH